MNEFWNPALHLTKAEDFSPPWVWSRTDLEGSLYVEASWTGKATMALA